MSTGNIRLREDPGSMSSSSRTRLPLILQARSRKVRLKMRAVIYSMARSQSTTFTAMNCHRRSPVRGTSIRHERTPWVFSNLAASKLTWAKIWRPGIGRHIVCLTSLVTWVVCLMDSSMLAPYSLHRFQLFPWTHLSLQLFLGIENAILTTKWPTWAQTCMGVKFHPKMTVSMFMIATLSML